LKLKCDFHLHTGSDPCDRIAYSEQEMIDLAGEKGYDVLSITNHGVVTFSEELLDYAGKRGILLIPGMELEVEEKHVLLINAGFEHQSIRNFQDLREAKEEGLLMIAPHPFFPKPFCLNGRFMQNRELFDAVEFSHFYHPLINYNRRAVRICRTYKIPLVGSSDTHILRQFDSTFTLIEAEKTASSVVEAVRAGRTEVVTKPLSLWRMFRIWYHFKRPH